MKTVTIQLENHKKITVFDSLVNDPAVWIKISDNSDIDRVYGRCSIQAARELVEALNTFIKEASDE